MFFRVAVVCTHQTNHNTTMNSRALRGNTITQKMKSSYANGGIDYEE